MRKDDLMAISRRLDEIIRGDDDPRAALVDLVGEHGSKHTAEEARVVFGSWRTRLDLVEETLRELLPELRRGTR